MPEDITIYEINQAIKLIRRVCNNNSACEDCPFRRKVKFGGGYACGLMSEEPIFWGEVEEGDDQYAAD